MSTSLIPALPTLRSHSIFTPSTSFTSRSPDEEWELVDSPTDPVVGQKTIRMVMREKDLIKATGKELRMTNLSGEAWDVRNGVVGSYKTLVAANLGFPVQQLVLNPTGRLLAVVGRNQVTVIVLPKSGLVGSANGELSCRSFAVDEFQFSPSASSVITKVAWHPWGEAGNSLWVLTSDGRLREYDVLHPEDPTQTFTFLSNTTASSSRFTAIDPLSRYATSFTFLPLTNDFGPAIIHVLAANGDLYAMGPILPLHAEVPVKWVQSVKIVADRAGGLRAQWVDNLIKQVKAQEQRKRQEEEDIVTPSRHSRRSSVLVGAGRHRASSEAPTEIGGRRATPEGSVKLHPPHLTESGGPAPGVHRSLLRQGPIVFEPGPDEGGASEEDEDVASDLIVWEGGEDGETILCIAWSGGRVDLGVMVDQPEPRWNSSKDDTSTIPTIPIVESVLLPISTDDESAIASNAPIILTDPLHKDVIYVQHSFGVDAISVQPWLDALKEDTELPSSDVVRLVETAGTPLKPIVGVLTFCNITFGYALVALSSSNQLASVELDFRVTESSPISPETSKAETSRTRQADSKSLISSKPLDYEILLNSVVVNQPRQYQIAKSISQGKPLATITSDQLQQISQIITALQARTQAIRAASQMLENHLDLCVKEYQRQLRLLKDSRDGIDSLRDDKIPVRAEMMLEKQGRLADRLDRVLGTMSAEYRPDIGEVERRWFDELERLRARVRGGAGAQGKGLVSRSQVSQEQLRAITPVLEAQVYESKEDAQQSSGGAYGTRQIRPLEVALGQRSEEIRKLMRRMDALSLKMEHALEARDQE